MKDDARLLTSLREESAEAVIFFLSVGRVFEITIRLSEIQVSMTAHMVRSRATHLNAMLKTVELEGKLAVCRVVHRAVGVESTHFPTGVGYLTASLTDCIGQNLASEVREKHQGG